MIENRYSNLGIALFGGLIFAAFGFFTLLNQTLIGTVAQSIKVKGDVVLANEFPVYIIHDAPACVQNYTSTKQTFAMQAINKAISKPITLEYSEKDIDLKLGLTPQALHDILIPSAKDSNVPFILDKGAFASLVKPIKEKLDKTTKLEINGKVKTVPDRELSLDSLEFKLMLALINRLNGKDIKSINMNSSLIELPSTNGELADKYIEVDKSQQRLYAWENGRVVKNFVISTGLSGPTYSGMFRIKNHIKNPWSSVANVWTPYWMAFTYNSDAGAWLGFHELPYWDGPNGEKIRRPFDTLGKPVTGGCIQLDIGDAKNLYDWAEDGMLVFVHE